MKTQQKSYDWTLIQSIGDVYSAVSECRPDLSSLYMACGLEQDYITRCYDCLALAAKTVNGYKAETLFRPSFSIESYSLFHSKRLEVPHLDFNIDFTDKPSEHSEPANPEGWATLYYTGAVYDPYSNAKGIVLPPDCALSSQSKCAHFAEHFMPEVHAWYLTHLAYRMVY